MQFSFLRKLHLQLQLQFPFLRKLHFVFNCSFPKNGNCTLLHIQMLGTIFQLTRFSSRAGVYIACKYWKSFFSDLWASFERQKKEAVRFTILISLMSLLQIFWNTFLNFFLPCDLENVVFASFKSICLARQDVAEKLHWTKEFLKHYIVKLSSFT